MAQMRCYNRDLVACKTKIFTIWLVTEKKLSTQTRTSPVLTICFHSSQLVFQPLYWSAETTSISNSGFTFTLLTWKKKKKRVSAHMNSFTIFYIVLLALLLKYIHKMYKPQICSMLDFYKMKMVLVVVVVVVARVTSCNHYPDPCTAQNQDPRTPPCSFPVASCSPK